MRVAEGHWQAHELQIMVEHVAEVVLPKAIRQAYVPQTLAEACKQDRMRAAEGHRRAHELQIMV